MIIPRAVVAPFACFAAMFSFSAEAVPTQRASCEVGAPARHAASSAKGASKARGAQPSCDKQAARRRVARADAAAPIRALAAAPHDYKALQPEPGPYQWLVTVNGKLVASPTFNGSNEMSLIGFPTLSVRRPGAPPSWSSPDDSVGIAAFDTARFGVGPVIAYRGGRYRGDFPQFAAIHNVRWTLEPGLYAQVWLAPDMFRLRAEVRRGFRGEDGFVATVGADWVARSGAWTFGVGPRINLADSRFMRLHYGISAADAASSRFAYYRPKGGLQSAGLYGSATYKFSDAWSATAHGGYQRLTAQAANSPIVRQGGSRNQFTVGLVASYTFGTTWSPW